MSALNASVLLTIAGGQPTYIAAGAQLFGSVHADGSGLGFSASGEVDGFLAGNFIGAVAVSYSSDSGALFEQVSQLATQIATWFRNTDGQSDTAVADELNQIGVSAAGIAETLKSVYADTDAQVATALYPAGEITSDTAAALKAALGDSDAQVASALEQIGIADADIASALQSAFQEGQAGVYNALLQTGHGGQSALDALSGTFDTGSHWVYSNPWYSFRCTSTTPAAPSLPTTPLSNIPGPADTTRIGMYYLLMAATPRSSTGFPGSACLPSAAPVTKWCSTPVAALGSSNGTSACTRDRT